MASHVHSTQDKPAKHCPTAGEEAGEVPPISRASTAPRSGAQHPPKARVGLGWRTHTLTDAGLTTSPTQSTTSLQHLHRGVLVSSQVGPVRPSQAPPRHAQEKRSLAHIAGRPSRYLRYGTIHHHQVPPHTGKHTAELPGLQLPWEPTFRRYARHGLGCSRGTPSRSRVTCLAARCLCPLTSPAGHWGTQYTNNELQG